MCLGPRCKAIDVGSFIPEAEARAELGLQCRENTTGECSGEQNPADLLMTSRRKKRVLGILTISNLQTIANASSKTFHLSATLNTPMILV